MKTGIKQRLFFSLLAATGLVAVGMFLILQWSLARGFLEYVQRLDRQRLDRLAVVLEEVYAERGDWDLLRRPGALPYLMREMLAEMDGGDSGPEGAPRRGVAPPHRIRRFERRLVLLDAQRRPVLGALADGETELIPLRHEGRTVGWVGLRPRKGPTVNQLRFLRHQKLAMALVAGLMLLVSALLSLPLAHRLVRPLRALAEGTLRLASGEYAARVPVESKDELGRLARNFNELALVLERNERDRRQWVADISHELRTPLAVLRGEIEALQDGVRLPNGEALASLHGEVLQLARLVDDLYQLSLSDLGALNYRKEPVDLSQVLGQVLGALRPLFREKGIAVEAHLPPEGTARLHGDPARLHQLATNLLENSLKYTDAGGNLEVRLSAVGGRLFLDLQDSAPGVSDADLERLFDRLYRVEGSRNRASGGAGLGLSICRSIVAAHEGAISASHSSLGGLGVRIELPAD